MARKRRSGGGRPPEGPEPALPGINPVAADQAVPETSLPFPIVAIGASAGGLPALSQMLHALPADTGMAFVVVMHLDPHHESALDQVLGRETAMRVQQAEHQMAVQANHVYVNRPNTNMMIGEGRLQLSPRTELHGLHQPIDRFMRSLAQEHGYKAIGVVLSGSNADGTQGLDEIKAAGGITFAQDATAQYATMPRSAIASGSVDYVLPPDAIGQEIARIARHPYIGPPEPGDTAPPQRAIPALNRVLELLRDGAGVDFTHYKRNTLHRRITRRMVLNKFERLSDYVGMLESRPDEVQALYQDILINVTSFFRNPEAYEALKREVFPRIAQGKTRHEQARAWAMGCSTGEEAYSIAMAYTEFAEESGQRVPMQIFATDLNSAGIERARAGVYPKSIAQDLSPERLRRFFVEVDGSFRISKPIRDMCVFARQNVLADPPFSHLDLLACRNVLIYLDPVLQQKVIPLMHYALRPGGILWLGHSESVGAHAELFELQDARNKFYVRRAGRASTGLALPARPPPIATAPSRMRIPGPGASATIDPVREADRLLLHRYAPAGVVLDANLDIVQFRGDTSPFLTPAPGRASLNLMKMLREGLLVAVRGAVHKARREGVLVREEGLRVKGEGSGWRKVNLLVLPIHAGLGDSNLLVLFEDPSMNAEMQSRLVDTQSRIDAEARGRKPETPNDELTRLKQELAAIRDYLQSVIEQQEAANEELQAANEEVQSANEELQSINEELETSKEEIQSSNEELVTVNQELNTRNLQLSQSNNDLTNLLASVQMAIVMLGPDLRIRRFTPAAEKMLNLIAADVGRPISDIKLNVRVDDLEAVLAEVLEQVTVHEREVQDGGGRWYSLRIRPYRTQENKIDGAVIMLVDIDSLKRAEAQLREQDRLKNEFIATLSHELRNPLAALLSSAQILGTAGMPATAVDEATDVLLRQTRNMARLVDELLDLSRIAHNNIQLRRERVDLLEPLRHAIAATEHERRFKRQELDLTVEGGRFIGMADALRIEQVFRNLLSNASKFSPAGGRIWVAVTPDARPDRDRAGGFARISVRDNGQGIAPELLPHVFEMFVHGDIGLATPATGTGLGLGLALAKRLVDLHGGTIDVRTEGIGKGAELIVRLPLTQGEARPEPAAKAERAPGGQRRVLIVEDNIDAARVLEQLLRARGHEVRAAHKAAAALGAARAFMPDVVLLDIGLPDADGFSVARQMRGDRALDGVLIVAVTGYGRDQDLQRGRDAGIDHHLTKPVDFETLQRLLAGATRPAGPAHPNAAGDEPGPSAS